MTAAPIGIFDSGLGGLSVWKEVVKLLPYRSVVYLSDNAFCPYGRRRAEELVERTQQVVRFLLHEACQMVVVACNTATAAAIDSLRASYPVPFVGMEPAVKPAALHSQTGVVGILATHGTFQGRLYQETSHRFASHVRIIEQVGDGLVELIEQGLCEAPQTIQLLHRYINPMIEAGADHLVLGCTHYPFLIPVIEKISDGRLTIIDPAPAVAHHVYTLLEQNYFSQEALERGGQPHTYRFYATGSAAALEACFRTLVPPKTSAQFFPFFEFPENYYLRRV